MRIENLDNIAYDTLELNAAFGFVIDYRRENNIPVALDEEFGQMQQEIIKNLNYANLFENTDFPIATTVYDEGWNEHIYTVNDPTDGTEVLYITVNRERKELNISGVVFDYSRK